MNWLAGSVAQLVAGVIAVTVVVAVVAGAVSVVVTTGAVTVVSTVGAMAVDVATTFAAASACWKAATVAESTVPVGCTPSEV